MTRIESFRPCCHTLTDRTRPSPHADDCPDYPAADCRTGGPWCIARACPIAELHRAESDGCILAGEWTIGATDDRCGTCGRGLEWHRTAADTLVCAPMA